MLDFANVLGRVRMFRDGGWSELKLANETILKSFHELSFTQEDPVGK
jgi:hypothetical protein